MVEVRALKIMRIHFRLIFLVSNTERAFSNVYFSSVSIQTGLSHQFEGIQAGKQLPALVLKWCEKALAPLGCSGRLLGGLLILEWGTKYWCAYLTIESRMTTM